MPQKYAAALTALAITLVGALAQLTGPVTWADAIQVALLGVNAVIIYLVPLAAASWQGRWKTIAAIAIALLTALAPLAAPGHSISGSEIVVVVLAGLQAFGAHIGVQLRKDETELAA